MQIVPHQRIIADIDIAPSDAVVQKLAGKLTQSFDGLADFTLIFERDFCGRPFISASSAQLNELFMRNLRNERFGRLFEATDIDTIEWMINGVLDDLLPVVAGLAIRSDDVDLMNFEFIVHPFLAWGRDRPAAFGHLRPLKRSLNYSGPAPGRLSLKSFRFLHPTE